VGFTKFQVQKKPRQRDNAPGQGHEGDISVTDRTLPEQDDDFGHWLAGFTDGEGCFRITSRAPRKPLSPEDRRFACTFTIGIRADDAEILHEAVRRLGVGAVIYPKQPHEKWAPLAKWLACKKSDCVYLADYFTRYPLRAKKHREFEVWKRAVSTWQEIENRGRGGKHPKQAEMAAFAEELRELRPFAGFTNEQGGA
jgi:hypothetical protein